MPAEHMKTVIRSFLKSITEGDVAKSLSFLNQDVVWVAPQGTFKGTVEVEKYLTWMKQKVKDSVVTEIGIGIMVQGNHAVIEHSLEGKTNNKVWKIPAMCIYEFKDEKIQNMTSFYDTLAQAKQVASGFIQKMVVNSVAKASIKGLR